MMEKLPALEKPRRDNLGPRVMRAVNGIWFSDQFLDRRAEDMLRDSGIQHHLADKIQWADSQKKFLGPKPYGGVNVLCVGAGKGHEALEVDALLPGSTVAMVDPHDFQTGPVEKRAKKLAHNLSYLSKENQGEQLKDVLDHSQDGLTLFYVMHHIHPQNYETFFTELKRVMKPDGKIFVAEDIVDDPEELRRARHHDQLLNLDALGRTHEFKSISGWQKFFDQYGFHVQIETIDDPDEKAQTKKEASTENKKVWDEEMKGKKPQIKKKPQPKEIDKKKIRHVFFVLTLKK